MKLTDEKHLVLTFTLQNDATFLNSAISMGEEVERKRAGVVFYNCKGVYGQMSFKKAKNIIGTKFLIIRNSPVEDVS